MIGVGVNLATREVPGLSTPPAGLRELLPGIDAAQVLLQLGEPLVRAVLEFEHHGFSPFAARFNARDVLRDREVTFSDGQQGTARGVDETGALLVHTAAGMKHVTSSEISVRPQSGPEALTHPCCACSS